MKDEKGKESLKRTRTTKKKYNAELDKMTREGMNSEKSRGGEFWELRVSNGNN